jgi:hypothetical protein
MSNTTKEKLDQTKEAFEYVIETSKKHAKQSEPLDKHLAEKIRKAGETASEVVKHIEKRSG